MNIWTMIVLIVAICVISDIIKSKNNNEINESENPVENLSKTLGLLKKRIENLETIVLEKERSRRFAGMEKN
ncbi:hypothetical protein ACFL6W_06865 [Thermodesulfobacteriota bacterium]